jgi:sugar phosphate isomerase/epimerase
MSSDAGWLARLVRRVDHPRCGALADFGNWDLGGGVWYDRYEGVAELVPLARAISVKAHEFDAQGNETRTDFARMLRIVADGGYRGPYLEIEYEGEAASEPDGIRATKRLVERTLAAL